MATNLLAALEEDIELAQDLEFSTEDILVPTGTYIGPIHKVARRSFTSGEETRFLLSVTVELTDPEIGEVTKRDKNYVSLDMFLNLDEEQCRLMDQEDASNQLWVVNKDSNPMFGRFLKTLKELGYERPTRWAPFWLELEDSIKGKDVQVKVTQVWRKSKDLDEDGNPIKILRNSISAFTKPE